MSTGWKIGIVIAVVALLLIGIELLVADHVAGQFSGH
jgi:hypothetical protein